MGRKGGMQKWDTKVGCKGGTQKWDAKVGRKGGMQKWVMSEHWKHLKKHCFQTFMKNDCEDKDF